jgi:hypothetical protein
MCRLILTHVRARYRSTGVFIIRKERRRNCFEGTTQVRRPDKKLTLLSRLGQFLLAFWCGRQGAGEAFQNKVTEFKWTYVCMCDYHSSNKIWIWKTPNTLASPATWKIRDLIVSIREKMGSLEWGHVSDPIFKNGVTQWSHFWILNIRNICKQGTRMVSPSGRG